MMAVVSKRYNFDEKKLYTTLSTSFLLMACNTNAVVLNAETMNEKFVKSTQNSAVSWWYLGEKDSYQYIAEKYPFEINYYKIKKEHSPFNFNPKKLTYDKQSWVNIKYADLKDDGLPPVSG